VSEYHTCRAVKADFSDKADASALSYGPKPVRFPSDAFRTVRNAQTVDPLPLGNMTRNNPRDIDE